MLEGDTTPMPKRVSLVPFLAGLLTATVAAAAAYFWVLPRLVPSSPADTSHAAGIAAPAALASTSASNTRSLAPLIAEEYESLNLKPHTVVLTTDKAMSAAEALRRGDYQSAESLANEVLARSELQAFSFSPFDRFINNLSMGDDPKFLDGLNAWVSKHPTPLAYLLRAKYFLDTAWAFRGEDFPSAVPSEHMRLFHEYLGRAADDVRQSISLDSNIPLSHLLRLQISEVNDDKHEVEQVFLGAIAHYPEYYPLYRLRLHFLQPKWSGSASAMHQFVVQYAASVPPSSPRNLLYMQLAANLLNEAWIQCRELKHELLTACMDAYMNRNIGAGMTEGVTKALNLYKFTDPIQFSNALWPILGEMANTQGDNQSVNSLLQLSADALGSNNELIQDSKHNNYVIDDITARVWATLGHSDNVEQKFKEALDDVERTPFANEEDKAIVLGEIYEHMTWFASNTRQYIKAIAYHDAANAVAGVNRGGIQYNKCVAYFQLHHYREAVDECTLLIDTHRGVLRAHVFRAWANESLKNYDAALAEFGEIAENGSDNDLRAGAVIDMEHINALLGKTANELAIFEKYPFVFNAQIQTAENLAIVYNNRCYAYMKSGEFKKALDDCNTSLRYGRLPDALHKQQELTKLLAGDST
jgi:tetratricopeptide (TPR) repeat protein